MTTTTGMCRQGQQAQVCSHFCFLLLNADTTGIVPSSFTAHTPPPSTRTRCMMTTTGTRRQGQRAQVCLHFLVLLAVRECHGFCHGFSWGTGRGPDFCTPQKPVPVARVYGFDGVSNSARNRERVPAHHSFPPTTPCHPPPQPPES
jgi:hypothetical protein